MNDERRTSTGSYIGIEPHILRTEVEEAINKLKENRPPGLPIIDDVIYLGACVANKTGSYRGIKRRTTLASRTIGKLTKTYRKISKYTKSKIA